jgi:nitrate/nitrite transport system ATP-binding protein
VSHAAADLRLESVGKVYPGKRRDEPAVIVRDISLQITAGEFVSLIGHSGCGKSTVLAMVAGLLDVTTGAILLGERLVRGPGPDRGVVFQTPCLFPWLNVIENVRLGVDQVMQGRPIEERTARAESALRVFGLGDSLTVKPSALSSGMRQRVALARAFALEPRTLLLDEPFGMLDSITRSELQDMLLTLGDACPTTLMVTHDIDEAILLSDRIAVMTDGPAARIRTILEVPFPRPRERAAVTAHPAYQPLRDQLLALL